MSHPAISLTSGLSSQLWVPVQIVTHPDILFFGHGVAPLLAVSLMVIPFGDM